MIGLIYCAIGPANKKYYGLAKNFKKRKERHIYDSLENKDDSHFHRAIRHHGIDNIKWIIIEEYDYDLKKELYNKLYEREKYWINKEKTYLREYGYNLTKGGSGGNTWAFNNNKEETRKKISVSNKRYWDNISKEDKEKRVNKIRGKKRSTESKIKYSKAKKGISKTKKHLENLSISLKKAKKGKRTYNQKSVDMYDLDMNFLESFVSIQDASRQTGHNAYTICKICKQQQQQVSNHIFKYKL